MKKHFRVLAAALALCMSLLCCPAALAATDTSTFQTVPYSQATAQPSGQRITITGKPNYSAATGNDTASFLVLIPLTACGMSLSKNRSLKRSRRRHPPSR